VRPGAKHLPPASTAQLEYEAVPHRWTALAVLLAGGFLPALDFFIVNVKFHFADRLLVGGGYRWQRVFRHPRAALRGLAAVAHAFTVALLCLAVLLSCASFLAWGLGSKPRDISSKPE